MKTFRQLGPAHPDDRELKLRMAAFVDNVIDTAPPHLHARGSLGPWISIPVFMQLAIMDTARPFGHPYTSEQSRKLERRLLTYRGFTVVPAYEMAVTIFHPSQAPFNDNVVYRVTIDNIQKQLPDGERRIQDSTQPEI